MKPIRILLADDHDVVREGLRSMFAVARPHWEICGEACNGREAANLVNKLRPDVVVMDFAMPEMNGLESTRKIRRAHPKTEVIILTDAESERLAQDIFEAGARCVLLKTDTKRYLPLAVEALSRHEPFLIPKISQWIAQGTIQPRNLLGKSRRLHSMFTSREREIVQLVAEGWTTKEIAHELGISNKTAETHRTNLMKKMNVHSVAALVRYAIRNKIIFP